MGATRSCKPDCPVPGSAGRRISGMSLRWEKQDGSEWAYSGRLVVGMIGTRGMASADGERYWYKLDAVHTKHIAKGHGEVRSKAAARKAVEMAWATWLREAGLSPYADAVQPYAN